ncbi:MAG TPA: hypothetical protein PKA90_00200 [Ignavibacteria bacterium]|nr:hypothetical protein [Ignavibacteria bacterium]
MKSIAIITPNTDTFSNPTLLIMIKKLIGRNYKIIFFGHKQIFIPSEIKEKMEFHSLPFNFVSFFGRPEPSRRLFDIFKLIRQYIELFRILRKDNDVKALICVDPMGIVLGGRIKKIIDIKLIYASFEIFFEDEIKDPDKKQIKKLEKEYSNNSEFIVIQDSEREKLLKSANDLGSGIKYLRIPVSPEKTGHHFGNIDLNNELDIPENKTIVVYSGSLQNWSGIRKILDLFPEKWDNEHWLLIHTHNDLPEDSETKEMIRKLISDKRNITFHNKPFTDFSEYAGFLSGCDIGLAVYFPNYEDSFSGKNVEEIGLSSGKFSTYIMLGKPTITTSNKIYNSLNEKYNFGYIINSADDIKEGICNIISGYETKVSGCNNLFKEVLDPEVSINNFMSEIGSYYQ